MKRINYALIALLTMAAFTQCKPKATQTTADTTATSSAAFSKADVTNITNREVSSWEFAKT
ncbi:MAG: hypothetical protein EOO13_08335, partial [Chitinophagaceae bacterium]